MMKLNMAYSTAESPKHYVKFLYFDLSKSYVYFYILSVALFYIFVYVHTPLTIDVYAPHDDTLYMSRGRDLAEGRWLGPYNEPTLAKGPGYPAFLALVNWLGISVSWGQALLQCTAVTVFVAVCHHFIRSYALSALLFALLLWHPFLLSTYGLRILRETIYPAQVLLFLATFAYSLFLASSTRQRTLGAVLSGLTLGWFWLTREEGIWVLPGIAILVAGALLQSYCKWRGIILAIGVTIAIFAGVRVGFAGVNWLCYGSFVGVEDLEKNFHKALGAIHSVVSGGTRPFVSVTRQTRQKIYIVSPAFKSLAAYFDGPADKGWAGLTCRLQPAACGEIGAGWFFFALRVAAAAQGHYKSPKDASKFYARIAREIEAGCASGALECKPQLISSLPPVTWDQLSALPAITREALDILLVRKPPLALNLSKGDESNLGAALRFLNYPAHTKSMQISDHQAYSLNGWYINAGQEDKWLWANIRDPQGALAWNQFARQLSPDWAKKLPKAARQRFTLRTLCSDDCVLELETLDGSKAEVKISEIRTRAPFAIQVGDGTFYVASMSVTPNPALKPLLSESVANQIRTFMLTNYVYVFLPVFMLGVLSFLISTLIFWRRAPWNACYIMALACWTLVATRISLLVLITATAMPVVYAGAYHSAAFHLVVAGAVLSIAALIQLAWTRCQEASERSPTIEHS